MPALHPTATSQPCPGEIGRVAIVAPSLDILGGQGVQAKSLAEALAAENISIDLIAVNPRFPKGLGWIRRIPILRTLLNQLLYIPSLSRIRHANVVHIFSASYWSFVLAPLPALMAARLFKKPSVLNYHSGEADDHLRHWGYRVHPWLRMANRIVVPSTYLQEVFQRYDYHTEVIRNVIDIDTFDYRERPTIQPTLLSNRNLEQHYGIHNTIKAFSIVKQRHPEAVLTIAGYGSQERQLRQLVNEQSTSGVRFLGRVEPEEMPKLYNEADVFVNASTVDNQPISILEAFASGVPVVSTPTGDIPNMMGSEKRGVLLTDNSPQTIADGILSLLSNPEWACEMARRARHEAELYTWPPVKDCWLSTYLQLIHDADGIESPFNETTTHS